MKNNGLDILLTKVFLTIATDLHSMYLTALGTKKYFVDTGTVLKDGVRGAVTDAEVELILDNR